MASSHSEELINDFEKSVILAMHRNGEFAILEDGILRDWIIELQAKVNQLEDDKLKLLKSMGNDGFAPVIY